MNKKYTVDVGYYRKRYYVTIWCDALHKVSYNHRWLLLAWIGAFFALNKTNGEATP